MAASLTHHDRPKTLLLGNRRSDLAPNRTTASRNLGQRSDASAEIQERLTRRDRDPSDSRFACHRVGLTGRTSAPPPSPSSFPHSEQSASERLEGTESTVQGADLLDNHAGVDSKTANIGF